MGGERGETNRWLVGIMGAVGAVMVAVVVGFQAQIDARQDEAMRQIAAMNTEIHRRQDETIASVAAQSANTARSLADVSSVVAEIKTEQRFEREQRGRR